MEKRSNIRLKEVIPTLKYAELNQFLLIAGPCVVEGEEMAMGIAGHIAALSDRYKIPCIFKASYRKANRTRLDSFTGIGDLAALEILRTIREEYTIPVVTDVHSPEEARMAADFVDMLQVPAFLSRQTDLLIACGGTGKAVSIKKGQFLSPGAIKFAAEKVIESGNRRVMIIERGTTFGYGDLVVDFRGIPVMQKLNFPVVLDVTHSLQRPNQESGVTGGSPELIGVMARAGIAAGIDGIFIETHPDPSKARSDGASMLKLDLLENLLEELVRIRNAVVS